MNEFPDVVELNVGGTHITTKISTLTSDNDSMLAAMFSGRHVVQKDNGGRYFIDCDGHVFRHLLEYLRFGTIPTNKHVDLLNVYTYAEYFGIIGLVKQLELFPEVRSVLRKRSYEAALNKDFHLYEELKQNAIKEVEAFYNSESILLGITTKQTFKTSCVEGEGKTPCQPIVYGNVGVSQLCTGPKVNISITSEISSAWSKCLSLDLRELGIARYTYYLDSCEGILRCKRCSQLVGRKEYVLLRNEPLLEREHSGWRKP